MHKNTFVRGADDDFIVWRKSRHRLFPGNEKEAMRGAETGYFAL
jgi:hypothetical protein